MVQLLGKGGVFLGFVRWVVSGRSEEGQVAGGEEVRNGMV